MEAGDRRKTRQGVEKNCMKRMQAGLYPRFTHEMNRRWRMWTFFRLFPEMVTKTETFQTSTLQYALEFNQIT